MECWGDLFLFNIYPILVTGNFTSFGKSYYLFHCLGVEPLSVLPLLCGWECLLHEPALFHRDQAPASRQNLRIGNNFGCTWKSGLDWVCWPTAGQKVPPNTMGRCTLHLRWACFTILNLLEALLLYYKHRYSFNHQPQFHDHLAEWTLGLHRPKEVLSRVLKMLTLWLGSTVNGM